MNTIYKNVSELLSDLCLDERVQDGIFDMSNNEHLQVLREKLESIGISKQEAVEMSNKVIEGKYPERQAYNRNGILVTFPNPEYKAAAIKRGTHFEEDPTKGQSNIDFSSEPTPSQPVAEPAPQVEPAAQPTSAVPQSGPPSAPTTPSVPQPASQPELDDLKSRPADQIKKDAEDVQKILTTEFTLDEAKNNGWIRSKSSSWYDNEGNFKGYEWYCIDSKQKKILSTR